MNLTWLPSWLRDLIDPPTNYPGQTPETHPFAPWTYQIDGPDLVVRNVIATCFGGKYDDGDNGQTESGYNNTGDGSAEANTFQVALPIRSTEAVTRNSPLAFPGPHIPWKTIVMVWREDEGEETAVEALLTDNGPEFSKYPTHAFDCNPPLALHFSPEFDPLKVANQWEMGGMSIRIVNGAKYAPQ